MSRWPGSRPGTRSAHEFVWRHRLSPYDLTVYQLGNSSHHDYLWPYLFRYPGLRCCTTRTCTTRAPRRCSGPNAPPTTGPSSPANHPAVGADLAELAVAGFDNHLYYAWPMTRLVVEASRLAVVHAPPLAAALNEELPHARVESHPPGARRAGLRRAARAPRARGSAPRAAFRTTRCCSASSAG